MRLTVLPGEIAVTRLAADASVPAWAHEGAFTSVTRTRDELSVVCAADAVPADVRVESGWRALRVEGPLDFALTGVLAKLAGPLADAGVPVFVVSTFDTDYVLVKAARLGDAMAALERAGHVVVTPGS